MRRFLPLLLLLVAVSAAAQTAPSPIEVEFGYRSLDIDGSEDMYRTQINEREGFILRALTVSSADRGLFDHFRLDVTDFGNGPAGAMRLEAGLNDKYRLRIGYREVDSFSRLPGFANPLLARGIVPGQHTYDRTRTMLDADLELFPGGKWVPFIGYSYNRFQGPGTTTYTLGGDDFLLGSDLNDSDHEIRAGVGFAVGKFSGQVTQGWRQFSGKETLTLTSASGGNNPNPILGRDVTLTTFSRTTDTDVSTPFTNAYVVGDITSRVKVIGQFSRFAANSDGEESEAGTGSFVSFPLGRFFAGLNEATDSRAKNTTWKGDLRAEIGLTDKINLIAGWRTESRELTGSALISTIYLNSITFGGADARDISAIVNAESGLDRDEDTLELSVLARALGPFTLRAGYSETQQDFTVSPDLEEIVVAGSQGGKFDRRIRTFDTAASVAKNGFSAGLAWRSDRADDPVLRTDFLDRDRLRLRAAYAFRKLFRVGGVVEQIDHENDREGIGYDGRIRQYSANVEVTPLTMLAVRAGTSRFRSDSEVLFRHPENFADDLSIHREKGKSVDAGVGLFFKKVTIDADMTEFENEGTYPFTLDRYRARVTFDVWESMALSAEYAKDEYGDTNLPVADYDARRLGFFLRWRY